MLFGTEKDFFLGGSAGKKTMGQEKKNNEYQSLFFIPPFLRSPKFLNNLKPQNKIYGGILAPCILFIIAFAQFNLSSEFSPLVPALKSNWLLMHVSIMIFSYTIFIVAGLISLILIIQNYYRPKKKYQRILVNISEIKNNFNLGRLQNRDQIDFFWNYNSIYFLTQLIPWRSPKSFFVLFQESNKKTRTKNIQSISLNFTRYQTLGPKTDLVITKDHSSCYIPYVSFNTHYINYPFLEGLKYYENPKIVNFQENKIIEPMSLLTNQNNGKRDEPLMSVPIFSSNSFLFQNWISMYTREINDNQIEARPKKEKKRKSLIEQTIFPSFTDDRILNQNNIPIKISKHFSLREKTGKQMEKNYFSISLDQISYRLFGIGFPLFTLGILSGAVWANSAWGSYWSWDIKETGSFVNWLVIAFYLHCRYKNFIKLSHIIAFISLIILFFNFFGISLGIFGSSLHAYGASS